MTELLSLVGIACLEVVVDLRSNLWCPGCLATRISFGKTDLNLLLGSSLSLLDVPLQNVSVAVLHCSLSPNLNAAFLSLSSVWTSFVIERVQENSDALPDVC